MFVTKLGDLAEHIGMKFGGEVDIVIYFILIH